jgi:hypothetical protein
MKRILLLVTVVAAMLAAAMALSGVAQAKPTATSADRQCMKLAIQTLPNFKPAHYTFHGGTEDSDTFDDDNTEGQPDVFCGFGGVDGIETTLDAGDIFLGGADFDGVVNNNGTFYGQEGGDVVGFNNTSGIFYGGADDDSVNQMDGGTFDGGDGTGDSVSVYNGGCVINVEIGVVNGTGC